MIGIATGGLTGAGSARGTAKWGFLPVAHSDFIFAVIAEELGFVGVRRRARRLRRCWPTSACRSRWPAPDRFGMLLAGGIIAWLVVQAIINVGGVIGHDAGHRPDAAVLLVRRQLAVRHDGRRPACCSTSPATCR